ncbi:response regulator [Methanoculleus chikugoensis]|uniref:response regulator n=1 Tax=Methanoculleus chikugoensis TaxID=118126 RepID=UPI0006D2C9EF|nr:response regulator [Methanoculleus chikugoensis]
MYRILVVDDEPTLLGLNRIYLEQSGDMQVETTSSPLQALDMLSEAPPTTLSLPTTRCRRWTVSHS